jgi:hypothetical protein
MMSLMDSSIEKATIAVEPSIIIRVPRCAMLSRLVDDDTVETMLIHPLTTRIEVEHGVSRYHRLIRKTQIGFLLTLEHRCGIKASIKNAKKNPVFCEGST